MFRVLAESESPYSSASATTTLPFEAEENEEYDGLAASNSAKAPPRLSEPNHHHI
jgi:hypothetical protein